MEKKIMKMFLCDKKGFEIRTKFNKKRVKVTKYVSYMSKITTVTKDEHEREN